MPGSETSNPPESNQYLFLSDAHLGGFHSEKNQRIEENLIRLVDYADREGYRFVILGDLFDYWMEYPDYLPDLGSRLLKRFRDYNRRWGATLYITGNHDNWTHGYFTKLGFEVERNYRVLHLHDRNLLVMHGDGVDDDRLELERPLLHRLLRHPVFVRGYQALLPPRWGLKLMKHFSRFTRQHDEERAGTEKLDEWAEYHLSTHDTDIVICGHDHCPRVRNYSFGTYVNLGTFYQDLTLARYNNEGIQLVRWNEEKRRLTT